MSQTTCPGVPESWVCVDVLGPDRSSETRLFAENSENLLYKNHPLA